MGMYFFLVFGIIKMILVRHSVPEVTIYMSI